MSLAYPTSPKPMAPSRILVVCLRREVQQYHINAGFKAVLGTLVRSPIFPADTLRASCEVAVDLLWNDVGSCLNLALVTGLALKDGFWSIGLCLGT